MRRAAVLALLVLALVSASYWTGLAQQDGAGQGFVIEGRQVFVGVVAPPSDKVDRPGRCPTCPRLPGYCTGGEVCLGRRVDDITASAGCGDDVLML